MNPTLLFQADPTAATQAPGHTRVGIDIVQISRVAESVAAFGDRFTQRLFTPLELAYASSVPSLRSQRLAARFAAKEAALKAFDLCEAGIDWRDIEVARQPDGACHLQLHGKAAECANAHDDQVALSLSHDGDYAMAVIAATRSTSSSFPNFHKNAP
jgi:holo-[acyl-carrier protein] synthase